MQMIKSNKAFWIFHSSYWMIAALVLFLYGMTYGRYRPLKIEFFRWPEGPLHPQMCCVDQLNQQGKAVIQISVADNL